ncbi:hypothetical protein GDO81_003282 [Engystomops pustulosus]|uniref:Secreted protein n=1 Tax=Engystomops pustulosus TaxID=76066 RepID=A0AAV6ZVM0_ENGPU|nr:hypothetical protein GDO81_003282 [Engystomops pustulosus]
MSLCVVLYSVCLCIEMSLNDYYLYQTVEPYILLLCTRPVIGSLHTCNRSVASNATFTLAMLQHLCVCMQTSRKEIKSTLIADLAMSQVFVYSQTTSISAT